MTATPKRYTKKPVTIDAVRYDGALESASAILDWIDSNGGKARRGFGEFPNVDLIVETLEGDMKAAPGWWIIRGLVGEFYPVDPDVFARSYNEAEEETA